ncbi:hypothetical protein N7532_006492 [Penicillium argentinense]|uniref:Uncharacterized protein n=1 Tax=Penicillium argentinense TaxID=1131581 RepID=A0A9W9FG29_9EURO|nr:uncharacterized protein N7532_006492 [Penicillium argentinense]KAJ5099491.1 hypothetical protein N7532_006492 [Penicillium argentinense]
MYSHLQLPSNFRETDSLFVEAADNGQPMVERILCHGYPIEPGSREAEAALYSALSCADSALTILFFEEGLICSISKCPNDSLLGMLDVLLAMDSKTFHFQILLDGGADPLMCYHDPGADPTDGAGSSSLGHEAGKGRRKVVQMMLKSIDSREIPLEKLWEKLAWAEERALEKGHSEIVPLLQRAYRRENTGIFDSVIILTYQKPSILIKRIDVTSNMGFT